LDISDLETVSTVHVTNIVSFINHQYAHTVG
jgi:hypothetical protein